MSVDAKPRRTFQVFCDFCNNEFTATQGNTLWCGKTCRDAARYVENRHPKAGGKPCELCGRDRGSNHRICQKCVKRTRGGYDPMTEYASW